MKETRLWQIIAKLSMSEKRELGKAVRSPWFNRREYVAVLYDYLRESAKQESPNPTKSEAFEQMFPGEKYSDTLLRNSMSLLFRVTEKYFAFREYDANLVWFQLQLARTYRRMDLEKHYWQTIRKVEAAQEANNLRDTDFYQNEYQLEAERYRHLSGQNRSGDLNLQAVSNNLDLSYITQKLRQTCFSISHQAVYPKDYDFGLLEKMLEYLEEENRQETPAVAVYYFCYRALTQPSEEHFFRKFKSLLILHAAIFPEREQRDLYLLAANYCIKKMNAGERQFAREGLEIFKDALSRNVLFADGKLSRFTFFNVLTKALVCEEFDWAEQFISGYQQFLEEKHREATASYSLARLAYHRGNHAEALQLLQKADYEDLLQNLQAKAIMAKIYFEAEEIDVLFSHLEAMQQFIRRRKVKIYHRDNFLNFIYYLKKLVETPHFEKNERILLRKEISAKKVILERRWLLEQFI